MFPYLRVLADYSNKKFLILGSASGELLRQSSESLAGRIEYTELTPFNLIEINDFRSYG
nr:AAA family ATPase [Rickettsia massiliae]